MLDEHLKLVVGHVQRTHDAASTQVVVAAAVVVLVDLAE